MKTTSVRNDNRAQRLLKRELEEVLSRLHGDVEAEPADAVGDDFFDLAQGVEQRELASLNAARLAERARRLRVALARLEDGDYGTCVTCGDPIPPGRLLAVPETTTCIRCQERAERFTRN